MALLMVESAEAFARCVVVSLADSFPAWRVMDMDFPTAIAMPSHCTWQFTQEVTILFRFTCQVVQVLLVLHGALMCVHQSPCQSDMTQRVVPEPVSSMSPPATVEAVAGTGEQVPVGRCPLGRRQRLEHGDEPHQRFPGGFRLRLACIASSAATSRAITVSGRSLGFSFMCRGAESNGDFWLGCLIVSS